MRLNENKIFGTSFVVALVVIVLAIINVPHEYNFITNSNLPVPVWVYNVWVLMGGIMSGILVTQDIIKTGRDIFVAMIMVLFSPFIFLMFFIHGALVWFLSKWRLYANN